MKRGGPLPRRTGLPRGTKSLAPGPPLTRSTPLRTTRPLGSGTPRPTPFRPQRPSSTAAERRARKLVKARAGEHLLCEICHGRPGAEWSHRVPRSGSGAWCPSNGIWACSDGSVPDGRPGCHQRAHRNPALAYRMGWFVRRGHDPAQAPVYLAAHGWVLLAADGGLQWTDRRPEDGTGA